MPHTVSTSIAASHGRSRLLETVQRFARATCVEQLLAKSVGRSGLLDRYKPKVRRVTGWIMADPDNLDADKQQKLADVLARCSHLDAVSRHVGQFAKIMLGLKGDRLDAWISEVEADDLPELHSFTAGLKRDYAAVLNGLTLPHSSGAVEGRRRFRPGGAVARRRCRASVNKLKVRKRQMYGRAKLDLLRKLLVLDG